MLKLVVALVIGGVMFGAVYGAAASMGKVDGAQVGASDAPVTSCQPETRGLGVQWEGRLMDIGPDEQGNSPDFSMVAAAAMVSGIDEACVGQLLSVQPMDRLPFIPLEGWQGPPLGRPCDVVIRGPIVRCPFPFPVELEDIWGVSLVIQSNPLGVGIIQ